MSERPSPEPAAEGGWIRRLWPFLMAHRRNVVLALGASVVGQGLMALAPLIQKVVVDDGIVGRSRPVAPWLTALVVIGVASFASAVVRRWIGGRVSLDVQYDLRNAIYERLQRLDFAGHDQLQTGQLVSRASTDLALIQGLLAFLPIMLGNVVMVVLALVIMTILSPPLTLVMVVVLPLLLVTALRLRRKVFPATWDAQQRAGEVAGVVDEAVSGVRVVKGFGQEDREIAHLADTAAGLYASRARLVRLQARFTSTLQAIPALAQVAVLALGGWLAIEGHLTLGTFLAFSAYLVQLVAPVRMLAGLFTVGQQARAGAERILDVLDANAVVTEAPDAVTLDEVAGEVRFEGVRFGYTRSEPVLDGLDLRIGAGEVVALVGTSGSGKSTVTALLPRFYDVPEGRVTIDGTDVREVTLESLRRQVGVVFEDAFLFSDSVAANIAYGRPDATHDDVVAAATAAGAHGFVTALPDGYATVVGERGLTLSGGQRQRIALARAILTDPRILVLDDATSAIDAATEEAIHATLRSLMQDRTTILIAHRRSTLRLAQRIVVLDAGRVVAEGSHESLMVESPRYRTLFAGDEDLDGEGLVDPALGSAVQGRVAGEGAEPLALYAERVAEADEAGRSAGAITLSAWPAPSGAAPAPSAAVAGPARNPGTGGGGGGGGFGGAALSATPELLAALDRLPPADGTPDVDVAAVSAPEDGPFRIRRFVRPWVAGLALGLGLVVLDTILTLLGPVFVSRGVDEGITPGDRAALWAAVVMFAGAVLVDWAVVWTYTLVTGRTAERMLYALRVKIFGHLQRMSLDYYDAELDGRLMTRMTTDVEALSQLVQTGLINAVVGVFTCVGVFVFLVILSPPLALAAASILPPLLLATWWYRRRSTERYEKAREAIADVNANLQESLSGVRVAQAYTREDRNISGFRSVNRRYLDHRLGAQRLVALYFPFILLLSDLGAVVVLGTGAALEPRGIVTAGVVIAFLLYLNQFFAPLQQLSQVLDTWQQASVSVAKIEELLATPSTTPPPADPVDPGRVRGEVRFEAMRFRYSGASDDALRRLDLVIPAGQTVALVGETGAGKSTVVKLVARFYDPTEGRVTVDGIDLRDIDLGAFRRQLGIVPQEAFLFTGTVRDNIAYGRPEATDAEVEAAARAVGAHEFVATLPEGYLTAVSERGRSLSSGQRQLIALARARLVDPAILLLDEATSQLDLATEGRVQRAMDAAAQGRTTLMVAHRLPTARRADRIVVVDDGRVVEDGTHDELVAAGGAYASLWAAFAETADDGDGALVP
ncbi:ABC transporter ATP-binding protein [Rhabdothermincola salaria]|uniref:ABC transporter ATP-binding protein n=1 Tax=Rhabdothermincola salaria TaxID=2903142 RepID=UPI001E577887|nr:ABC transporter ATP-binding protein/permease [Rhabdothermincola salaria]